MREELGECTLYVRMSQAWLTGSLLRVNGAAAPSPASRQPSRAPIRQSTSQSLREQSHVRKVLFPDCRHGAQSRVAVVNPRARCQGGSKAPSAADRSERGPRPPPGTGPQAARALRLRPRPPQPGRPRARESPPESEPVGPDKEGARTDADVAVAVRLRRSVEQRSVAADARFLRGSNQPHDFLLRDLRCRIASMQVEIRNIAYARRAASRGKNLPQPPPEPSGGRPDRGGGGDRDHSSELGLCNRRQGVARGLRQLWVQRPGGDFGG